MRRTLNTLYRPVLTMLACASVTLIAVISSVPSHSHTTEADPTPSAIHLTHSPSPAPQPSRTASAFPSAVAHLAHQAVPSPKPKAVKRPAPAPSRSHVRRPVAHTHKVTVHKTATVHTGSARAYARSVLSASQYTCLDMVVTRESGWNTRASNPYSGAYGLGQALPGSKMASYGSDWRTNGITQIRWVIHYMNSRYGSPCGAWGFWRAHRWY